MKQLSPRLLITGFFIIAFAVIGFFVVVTYKNVQQIQLQNRQTTSSLNFLLITEKLRDDLQELSAAQRGYVFTSRENHAAPHKKAVEDLIEDIDSLTVMMRKSQTRQKEINTIIALVQQRINDSKHAIALFDSSGIYAVVDELKTGASKRISDSLRYAVKVMELADHSIINESNKYLETTAQKTSYRFFTLSFIFLGILVGFLLLIYVDFKKKERVAAQLQYQASLIDTIPDAIFTTDKNFIVKSWNKYAAELYGIAESEAIGLPINALFTIHNTKEKTDESLSILNKKGFYKDEYQVTKRNKEVIFVLASVNTIPDGNGDVRGYVAVHRDITERKKLEDRQKEFSLELAKEVTLKTAETTNILERITEGFLALDSNFTFKFVNKKAGEILGHLPEQMIGKNIFTDFNKTASQAFNEACSVSFQQQRYTFFENHYMPLNTWLENDIYPSPDGLSIFFKDVTFKRNAETALKESEERYRHLIEYIHAGVVVHRPDSSILLYNQEAARLLGLQEKVPLDESATATNTDWLFISAEGKRLTIEEYPVMQVIRSGKPLSNFIAGIENPASHSRFWVLVNAFPEFDDAMQLKQVVVTFVDITDGKKAAEELKRSEDNLNMAQYIAKTGSWEFNMQTNELKWSKELYRIFELENTPSDQLYEAYRQKFHPEDVSKLDAMMQQAMENKRGYTYQHRIIDNNGNVKHILGIGEVILSENGELIGLKGTGQDITDIIKAEEKLQSSYKQIKQLVTHLQDIREQERTNMAREIHDELGQQLTGLKMYISWLNKKVLNQEPDIKEKFNAAIELIEDTIKSVRKISMDLRPSMLDDLGLLAALEWQSNEFEKRSGINTEFINQTENRDIPARLKTGLFRIYQESLTNVARHADAKKIVSSLKFDKNNLVLTITDDGKGFAFKNIESKKTLGLFGMKERTMEMGGKYEIISEPGNGTTVSVIVPLNI
jgi:PAS domain S-box-containing protein